MKNLKQELDVLQLEERLEMVNLAIADAERASNTVCCCSSSSE